MNEIELEKLELYTKYPLSSLLIYNGITILHYLFGGFGIILGYDFTGYGFLFGLIYLFFAFVQMYIIMPMVVCPNCVYYKMKNSLCTSGLNIVSRKIAKQGNIKDFANRAGGLSHNKLYMAALFIPIIAMIPALIINFSFLLLAIFIILIGLLLFRMFVLFRKIACVHCRAKKICPNAQAMGLDKD